MKKYTRKRAHQRKRRIECRLRDRSWGDQRKAMLSASNFQYETGDRLRGTAVGGIGMMHLLARQTGLIETIDSNVEVLKKHLPYHESDHVLNIVYDALSGGTCLGDIELRRQDEVYLDARPAGSRSDDRGRLLPAVRKRRRRAVEASITETLKRV